MSGPPPLYVEPSVEEKEEQKPPACPICGDEMFTNESGELQCPSRVYHQMSPKTKKFMEGKWFGQKNIKIEMLWQGKPIGENPPVCDSCGHKVSGIEVELAVGSHHVSYAAYACNRSGEYRQKLAELYDKVRKRKISATEVFRIQTDLAEEYVRKRPSAERPVDSTQGYVPLKCSACRKELGSIQVNVKAFPEERPEAPTYRDYALLPKMAEENRLIEERFHIPKEMKLENWLDGKDLQKFIKKLEAMKEDVSQLPYMRLPARSLSNLSALIYTVLGDLQNEVSTRADRVYELLKSPPKPLK